MAVDPRWLEDFRAQHRRRLGLGGMGADASAMLAPYSGSRQAPPAQVQQIQPAAERPWIKKLVYGALAVGGLGLAGAIVVALWPKSRGEA